MKFVQNLIRILSSCFLVLALSSAYPASGALWTNWTSAQVGYPGTATGLMNVNGQPITLIYTGEVALATQVSGGKNFWIPNTPYLSPTVTNEPPDSDIIGVSGGYGLTSRINFSSAVSNPIMAINSLGTPTITIDYHFNRPFEILSYGPGYWPGPGTLLKLPNNVLRGIEGHGVIQFQGTFTSISWTIPNGEYWQGFQVGLVPEPSTSALLICTLSLMHVTRARARRNRCI